MKLVSRGVVERSRGKFRTMFATGPTLKPYTVVVYCPAQPATKCREDFYTEHVYAKDRVDAAAQARQVAFHDQTCAGLDHFMAVAVFEGHLCEAEFP